MAHFNQIRLGLTESIELHSIVFNLSIVFQSGVDGAAQDLVVELASFLTQDVTKIIRHLRSVELHVLEDESTAIA